MRLTVTIDGDIIKLMAAEARAGRKAVKRGMVQAGAAVKGAWRAEIAAAGLGERLARSIRSQVYPIGDDSFNAATLIWTKAPKIIGAHDQGPLIRSARGVWLAIPLPAAGFGRYGRKLSPQQWEQMRGMKLRFVYRPGRAALLVADGRQNKKGRGVRSGSKTGLNRATVPIFVLVPQVKLQKRLDIESIANRVGASVPGMIVANWKGVGA